MYNSKRAAVDTTFTVAGKSLRQYAPTAGEVVEFPDLTISMLVLSDSVHSGSAARTCGKVNSSAFRLPDSG